MRCPWRPDYNTEDPDEWALIYLPAPIQADVLTVEWDDPDEYEPDLVDSQGNALTTRFPFGFQVPTADP